MATVGGTGDLNRNVDYAFLSDDVFQFFTNKDTREIIKKKLISILNKFADTQPENTDDDPMLLKENTSKYYLHGSLFDYEKSAIDCIIRLLDKKIIKTLANVYIFDVQTNNYYEYDLIIIARSGIYVVELKHWSGHIEIEGYQWRINKNRYRVDPHKNNSFKCKVLKGIYQHRFVTYPDVWVESVVVLTNPEAIVERADSPEVADIKGRHNLTFASIADFISYLKRRDKKMQILEENQVCAIADFLADLNRPKQQKEYTVPGYETVEYLSQKPEYIELLARPIGVKAKGLHRLRVFRFVQESEQERERFRKIALNTLDAVQQIGEHPYIHKVSVSQTEEGDIIEISEWSETGTLQDLIYESEGRLPLEQGLTICRNIALALNKAHQENIIHRAVKPENILIKNGIPKLMNFDLSFQLEDNRLTVIPDAAKIKDDGYVAPELLFGEDIDESTDYFSLGVIAYHLLTGEKPFKSTREFVARGGALSTENRQRLVKAGVPEAKVRVIEKMITADRTKRVKDIDTVLSVLTRYNAKKDRDVEVLPENSKLQPGDIYNMYEIVEFIGKGAETQIYKAKAPRGQIVVLKVFNYETSLDRVFRELDVGCEIRSPYVVRCERRPGHWHGKRYFIVMDYIPGQTLRELIGRKERPDRNTFNSVARSLMEGIRAFHEHKDENGEGKQIVHGDIKPENIIITSKQKPVIIDFGLAGEPRVDVFQGTSGYIPPDTIRGADRDFSPRGDLFALGVTLWEWLFGQKPYANPAVGDKPMLPEDLPEFRDLYPWLLKAVATEPREGFATITEMWDMFVKGAPIEEETSLEEADEVETLPADTKDAAREPALDLDEYNSFVAYLNSLSCASAGNENAIAECQIRNEHFAKIYIRNPLTDTIHQWLEEGKNVILTGNAGDGKTTIAVDILQKVMGDNFRELNPRQEVPDQNLVIIKDMSELPEKDRAYVLKEALENELKTYLIVSNTGTLLEAFGKLKAVMGEDVSETILLSALEASEPTEIMDNRFRLLNIGQLDSINIACDVFKRMLEPENWTGCSQCKFYGDCPILSNVKLLQSNLELVLERVYLLYKRLYEYGQRLTMRQMTGHLAYALTGGLNCSDVANMSLLARRQLLCRLGFFNRFFGDDGSKVVPEAMKLVPVKVIQEIKFGSTLVPKFERKTWLKEEAYTVLNSEAREAYKLLIKNHSPQAIDKSVLRRQIRRLAYFCGRFEGDEREKFISTFLDSPMLLDYLKVTRENAPLRSHLRRFCIKVLHVLQEHFTGLRLPEETWKEGKDIYITLKSPGNNVGTQMILARLRQDDFELVVKPRYQYKTDGGSNKVFSLIYKAAAEPVELELDLPFFDYVARRYEGEIAQELSAYYSNRLEDFKGKLLKECSKNFQEDKSDTLYLLRIRPDRRFEELNLQVSEDGLEVI